MIQHSAAISILAYRSTSAQARLPLTLNDLSEISPPTGGDLRHIPSPIAHNDDASHYLDRPRNTEALKTEAENQAKGLPLTGSPRRRTQSKSGQF